MPVSQNATGIDMDFGGISFEQLQVFAYPLIKALGGPDIGQEIEDKADVLLESGNLLIDAGAVLHAAAAAMEDGVLTDEEIDEIIGGAEDLADALFAIQSAWYGEPSADE